MYGYVRPKRGELKVREYERFRSVYCGLCHHLSRRYGPVCRFLVNYDFTFLAMALAKPGPQSLGPRRCPFHPLRKYPCLESCESLDRAADYTVVLAWWKLRDGAMDGAFFKAAACRLACLGLKRAYKKAARRQPDFAKTVQESLQKLDKLEKVKSASLDETADTFAAILRAAAEGEPAPARRRVLEELFYHLGRTVYILDAVDDLGEDVKRNAYNPLRYRFSPEGGRLEQPDGEALRLTLRHSHNSMISAYELMDETAYSEIVSNVIYLGLPAVTQAVFAGTWRAPARKNRERSSI